MDLTVTGINAPLNNCASLSDKLSVTIRNNSNMPILNQEITLNYAVNEGEPVSQKTILNLAKGATQTFTFDTELKLSSAGKYNLKVTLPYGEDANTADNDKAYEINVFSNPTVDFGIPQDTVRTSVFPYTLDAGADFKTYLWNDKSTGRYLNASREGKYTVMVTDVHNCSVRDSVYVLNTTATISLEKPALINVYPNPVSNYLYISVGLEKRQSFRMEMVSPEGKVMYQKEVPNADDFRDEIDVSGFPEGLYFIRFYVEGKAKVYKVVVK
jgi:hypothetical protein